MTIRVFLKAADPSGRIDLSWEGEAELVLSVGPIIRGRFLNMHIVVMNGIANRTATLQIEERAYELTSVEGTGTFEAVAEGLSGYGPPPALHL